MHGISNTSRNCSSFPSYTADSSKWDEKCYTHDHMILWLQKLMRENSFLKEFAKLMEFPRSDVAADLDSLLSLPYFWVEFSSPHSCWGWPHYIKMYLESVTMALDCSCRDSFRTGIVTNRFVTGLHQWAVDNLNKIDWLWWISWLCNCIFWLDGTQC